MKVNPRPELQIPSSVKNNLPHETVNILLSTDRAELEKVMVEGLVVK